jgi:2-iminobutanoate/2-iminopropanoate deaminase
VAEARLAFVNLRTVVDAAGASLERVVRTTVFLGSADDFPTMNRLLAEFFPAVPPVRSTPIVSLPRGFRSRSTRSPSSADGATVRHRHHLHP